MSKARHASQPKPPLFTTLKGRLYAMVIGLATVPVLVLGFSAGEQAARVLERQSLDLQTTIAKAIEREIEDFVAARVSELQILDRTHLLPAMSREELRNSLNRMLGHGQIYHSLHIIDNGVLKAHASRTDLDVQDTSNDLIYLMADLLPPGNTEPVVGSVYFHEALREPLLNVFLPIVDRRSGDASRVLVAEVRVRHIWDLLAELELPGTTEAYVLDASNQVVAHRLAATVLANTRLDLSFKDGRQMLADGEPILAATRRLASFQAPTYVVVTRTEEDALAESTRAKRVSLILAGIILLLASTAALIFTRQINKPIQTLVSAARRISDGGFDTAIDVRGPSEMRELGTALAQMTQRLARMIDELEHSRYAERQLAMVTLECIGDAVITTDEQGVVRYLNPIAEQLSGWPLAEAVGKPVESVFRIVNEHSREPAPDPVARCLAEGQIVGLANHSVLLSRDGREYAIQDSAAPIRDSDGTLIGAVMVFSDVSATRAIQREITHQAMHDALTGLVNRREFEHRLKRVIATAHDEGSEHALCYMDLDQFKVINDTCGHAAGDELLRQVAAQFRQAVRRRDTLARLGGDEFAVLMEHCDLEQALRASNALSRRLEDLRFLWEEHAFSVGVSIGLVPISDAASTVDQVMRAADAACYLAKERGRNRVHVYREDDADVSRRHGEMQWVSTLTKALDGGRFELHAQPIVTLGRQQDDALPDRHFEVLLRLLDGNGDYILPGAFLPAAERYNLISRIDRWVVDSVLAWLVDESLTDSSTICSINLSGASIGEEGFLEFILSRFKAHAVPGERVCFEITETAAIGNLARATQFIQAVRRLGCRFALDDFGSGLSSFAYLKTLQVDYLKIDGSFVKDMAEDPVDLAMVRSINDVGQLLGMKTVAEFVESEAILEKLIDLGVDAAQGNHLGQPKPLKAA